MNYLLTISYDGKNYKGWQKQPSKKTIQAVLEASLKQIFNEDIKLIASGRTDTGVSALGQSASFISQTQIGEYNLKKYINAILPNDIKVLEVKIVSDNFHARYDAVKKIYSYSFYLSKVDIPYYNKFAVHAGYNLDINLLKESLQQLVGTHDFTSLSSIDTKVENKIRTIYDIEFIKNENIYTVVFTGDGFLKNMVRIIMGTAFDIAKGKIKADFLQVIKDKNRCSAGVTAKPDGLVLVKVNYA